MIANVRSLSLAYDRVWLGSPGVRHGILCDTAAGSI